MRIYFLLAVILFSVSVTAQKKNELATYDLRCENHSDPLGMDAANPRFSWKVSSTQEDVMQTGYELRVSKDSKFKNSIPVNDASSGESILVSYAGKPLEPLTRYYWQVRIKDNKGNQSQWSKTAFFETGFLGMPWPAAKWIETEKEVSDKQSPAPTLARKEFKVGKRIASARYYITSRGLYIAYLNGKPITDKVFTPGWTAYQKRLQYQVFDVTSLLSQGVNTTGIELAEGWYRGELGWVNNRALYGKRLGLLAELHITYTDGTKDVVATDESWKATDQGPVRFSGIYNGEIYDARLEQVGWNSNGFNDGNWWNVKMSDNQQQALTWQQGAYVSRIEEITPVKILRTPKGELVADMGQNMVGRVRLTVKGDAGATVNITHAEVLDKQGNFYTENLRAAKQLFQYTLKGVGEEVYEPHFTFMGFRYIRIEGFPGELKPENVKAIVIHSEMKPTSSFETSSPLINQLQHNIVWGQKGNFLDVPTDCPQRDERLGWTGDAQAFVRTAAFNMDIQAFFTKWMKDVEADQYANGAIPFVVPDVLRNNGTSAGWADVAVIAPWTIYLCYGDKRILEEQYASMKKYVEYIRKQSGDSMIWKRGSVFGDWLYYKPEFFQHTTPDGHTDLDLISTAFYGYSTSLLAKAAGAIGKKDDEMEYKALFNKIRDAFNREYVSASGRVYSGSQTSYVLALMFDLLPESKRQNAASYLVNDIKNRGNHLSTGFLGTSYLCHVLSRFGHDAVAYDLLFQESFPSWLYPVKMGATTIWERWDGIRADSSFQDKGMNSFNHYAYGAIGEWMYRKVAGIETDDQKPGYKSFKLEPVPGGKFSFVKASFDSPHGEIRSGWEIRDGVINYTVKIPANTTADIRLPKAGGKTVSMNGKPLTGLRQEGEHASLSKGSGEYSFTWAW
jgi:alpha-L-rhamnosidase